MPKILSVRSVLVLLLSIASVVIFVFLAGRLDQETTSDPERIRSERSKRMKRPQGHPDLFAQWHAESQTLDGASGPGYPLNHRFIEFEKTRAAAKRSGVPLDWKERGPANVSGRTRALIVDPDDQTHGTWFAGAVGGGVWKTEDAGQSWMPLTDHLPNLGVSSMAMAPSDHDVIYVGTGEGFFNLDAVDGSGIFKTTDRGQTWTQLTSTALDGSFRHVNRLVVDPSNADVVLAATNTGIYRSENGGQDWSAVYPTGGSPDSEAIVQDLRARPDDFNVIFAAENEVGVHRSLDAGRTWELVSGDEITGGFDRIELAISPSDPDVIYASIEHTEGSKLARSIDGGDTWVSIADRNEVNPVNWLGGQGWYDNTIAVHPFSSDIVYLGGIELWKATPPPPGSPESRSRRELIGLDRENTESFLDLVNFGGGNQLGGFVESGDADFSETGVTRDDFVSVEIRFGPGKSQKAHRFTVAPDGGTLGDGGQGIPRSEWRYQDYVEVPFEVWDIDNDQRLMVSFRDQADDGTWNLIPRNLEGSRDTQSREYVLIHTFPYDADAQNAQIAGEGGAPTQMLYFFWPVLASGGRFELPESVMRIRQVNREVLLREISLATRGFDVHVDHHNIVMIPIDEDTGEFRILNANDGGVYWSPNGGETWQAKENGYNTAQFYAVAKRPGRDQYIGGMQDNGTWRSGFDPDSDGLWGELLGGDGFASLWKYDDPKQVLMSAQFNYIVKSKRGGGAWGFVDLCTAGGGGFSEEPPTCSGQSSLDSPFFTQLAGSDVNPNLVFTIDALGIWRSEDFGDTWSLFSIGQDDWADSWYRGQVRISRADPDYVWAGSRLDEITPFTGSLYLSTDGGRSFDPVNVPSDDIQINGRMTGLATHPGDPCKAYALYSLPDLPKILATADCGQTWKDLSGFANPSSGASSNGFPDVSVYDLLVFPESPNVFWAGTEIGLFVSFDEGATWEYSDNGLLAASIWRLEYRDDQVIVATHGRGIWTVDVTPDIYGSGISEEVTELPDAFRLEPNYPNPFNPTTTLAFSVPEESRIEISVFDVTGRKVADLVDERYPPGHYEVVWNAGEFASGTYFSRMMVDEAVVQTETMTLVK